MLLLALTLGLLAAGNAALTRSAPPVGPNASGKRWYHDHDHPVHTLFRRQDPNSFLQVGSPEWTASFPSPANFPPTTLPKTWTDALNASVAAGNIPKIPNSILGASGSITYPPGYSATDPKVCSAYFECRAKGDMWDAPNGQVALAFDDGPLAPSPTLYNFLKSHNQHATHFFIGGNIYNNWKIFLQAFQDNQDDIAVHTYTHPYMTTLSNERVLAELGYTMQIIHDSTGGRVPKYWRPPFGDVDNRVRAIAREVFDLTTVVWNQDSADWSLTYNEIPLTQVEASLKSFYTGKKSPGLVILEHELSNESVEAFIYSWPIMQANGWNPVTIPDASGDPTRAGYFNSINDTDSVLPEGILSSTSASTQVGGSSTTSGTAGTTQRTHSSATSPVSPSHTSTLPNSAITIQPMLSVRHFIGILACAVMGGFFPLAI